MMVDPEARQWLPQKALLLNAPGDRSPEKLTAVVDQFNVAFSPRYRPSSNAAGIITTYCNIFVWDVTSALCCEIPHWVDRATGMPAPVGKGFELLANQMPHWLEHTGKDQGWHRIVTGDALVNARVNAGHPVVALWANPSGAPGHVAVCVPAPPGKDGVWIAQAGKACFALSPIRRGFGERVVMFWTCD